MDAAAFRAARIEAGISQREVAIGADVEQGYVSRWERGLVPSPSERCIAALKEALDKIQRLDTISRHCSKCGEEKPIRRFPRDPKGRGGRSAQCGKCKSNAVMARAGHAPKTVINRPLSSARLDRLLERANVRYDAC